jgi:hypothetical protein
MDKDVCKLRVGPYQMHFTGYQPESAAEKEFCEDIPSLGKTIIVLDDTEHALREVPIEVRIIRNTGDESSLDAITVLRSPAKVYPSGSVYFEHTFTNPGRFVGIVTVGDRGQYISRFPFAVGEGSSNTWRHVAVVLAVVGAGLVLFLLPRLSGRTRHDDRDSASRQPRAR